MSDIQTRIDAFCARFGLRVPILLAPMAGACPPALSIAVANAGGMGAAGVLLYTPQQIAEWVAAFRAGSNGSVQLNLWIPDPDPVRDAAHEERVRAFLGTWGPEVPAEAGDTKLIDFDAQCEAMLAAQPTVISSIMGVYPPDFVARLKQRGIAWFATVTTVAEARQAEAAGADVIVAQGAEAGGHRGAFDAARAERDAVGLFALLPAVADAVRVPVVAAGGIADGRSAAAAFLLGASAVAIGTGFLRSPEAGIPAAWADALAETKPEDTMLTRAFSGRAGRSIANDYARAASAPDAPRPAPYPVQRALTAKMRSEAQSKNDASRMQAWSGQAAAYARAEPAASIVENVWRTTQLALQLR
jgi:nitronate monooxygenase